jgi:hypothetical protein
MKRIRIMHVITQLAVGGAETQLVALCKRMPQEFYETRVISLVEGGKLKVALEEAGSSVIELDRRRVGGPFGQMRALVDEMRTWDAQILQTWLRKANHVGRIAGMLSGRRRMIATVRDMGFDAGGGDTALDLLADPLTSLYLHNSEQGRDAFLRRLRLSPRRKHGILRNGIDAERFRPDPERRAALRQQKGLGPEDFVTLMVARLDPIKDPSLFLDIARRTRAKEPHAHFWLVGGGKMKAELMASLKREPDSGIWLAGERQDVPDLLAAADLALLTSHSEGLSNTILEAMSASLPVIATDVGGNQELIVHGENGVLSTTRDAESISNRLIQLMSSRERLASMGRNGRRRVEDEFSMATLGERADAFYRELLRN